MLVNKLFRYTHNNAIQSLRLAPQYSLCHVVASVVISIHAISLSTHSITPVTSLRGGVCTSHTRYVYHKRVYRMHEIISSVLLGVKSKQSTRSLFHSPRASNPNPTSHHRLGQQRARATSCFSTPLIWIRKSTERLTSIITFTLIFFLTRGEKHFQDLIMHYPFHFQVIKVIRRRGNKNQLRHTLGRPHPIGCPTSILLLKTTNCVMIFSHRQREIPKSPKLSRRDGQTYNFIIVNLQCLFLKNSLLLHCIVFID